MTIREKEVFLLIKENPMVTQDEIAEKLGISRSAVSVHISSLLRQGALRGRGYVVNEEDYRVVIGTAGIDLLGTTEGQLSDSVTDKIVNYYGQINVNFGGAAYNISETLCKLGESARLVASIGSDIFGRQIMEQCAELRINTDDCLFLDNTPQSIMLQIRNENTEQHTAMVNYFTEARMTPGFFAGKSKMLRNASGIVLTDIISADSAEYLLTTHNGADIWFVFSGVISRLDKLGRLGSLAPHVYMNLRAAAHMTHLLPTDDPSVIGDRLRELGFQETFISCDNRTIMHVTKDFCRSYPTLPNTKSDSERGKDAFVAGLVATANSEKSMEERICFASAVSNLFLKHGKDACALSRDAVEHLVKTTA